MTRVAMIRNCVIGVDTDLAPVLILRLFQRLFGIGVAIALAKLTTLIKKKSIQIEEKGCVRKHAGRSTTISYSAETRRVRVVYESFIMVFCRNGSEGQARQ